ncbi:MAG: hypothetical protein ABIL16_02890 [candidate division WOR-3 bacterium]
MAVPFCRYFGECPRCFYQDVDYKGSVRIKVAEIREIFGIDPKIVESPKDKFYKFRVILNVKRIKRDKVILGYSLESGIIFGISACPILRPKINDVIGFLQKQLSNERISTWDPEVGKGKLMGITFITNDDEVVITLNLRRKVFLKKLTYDIIYSGKGIGGIWWVVKGKMDYINGGRGKMFLPFEVEGIKLKLSPFGIYPDNLYILPKVWEVFDGFKGALALGTGYLFPLNSIATYVEENPLILREMEENRIIHYSPSKIESLGFKSFSFFHTERYEWVVINTDRFLGNIPEVWGNSFVFFGRKPKRVYEQVRMNKLKVKEIFVFDTEPYTKEFLMAVISER